MAGSRKSFREKTEIGLVECGKWLEDNAAVIAAMIDGGCDHWDIAFSWDLASDDPNDVPVIDINVRKYAKNVVDALVRL